jgi:DNA-binding NarL/FixJ family response regulator
VLSSNLDEEPLRGFELLRELRAANPDLFAVMLLDSSKKETVLQAFRAGARGISAGMIPSKSCPSASEVFMRDRSGPTANSYLSRWRRWLPLR